MTRRVCEECGTALDPAKILRCTKCKACFYCSAKCQKRNWKRVHKRVCSTDPALRPFIRVEMAVERALAKQRPMDQAPKDATCYICLEGEDDGEKLMRGCACRGDNAGFVHLECLKEYATSNEDSVDDESVTNSYGVCINCRQPFNGALRLHMRRSFWRRHKNGHDYRLRRFAVQFLADCLLDYGEVDTTDHLYNELRKIGGHGLVIRRHRADMMIKNGHKLEGLQLLRAMVPEAKEDSAMMYFQTLFSLADVLYELERNDEAFETATDAVAIAEETFGLESPNTLIVKVMYASICSDLGYIDKMGELVLDNLAIATQTFGPDHSLTQKLKSILDQCTTVIEEDDIPDQSTSLGN